MSDDYSDIGQDLPHAFELLIKGYFHQDWDLNGRSAHEVLDLFCAHEGDDILAARNAAQEVRALDLPEADLKRLLVSDLGLHYSPRADGMTYTDWLDLVVTRLSAS